MTTTATTMAKDMAMDRSGGGGKGGWGAGLFPGTDKINDNSNMKARERETNRDKTLANTNTKTNVWGKGGGLDNDLGWATNFLAGGQFDIYVDSEGGSAEKKILLGKKNRHLKQRIILPQTKY